jgi:hypothetical protein
MAIETPTKQGLTARKDGKFILRFIFNRKFRRFVMTLEDQVLVLIAKVDELLAKPSADLSAVEAKLDAIAAQFAATPAPAAPAA